MVVDCRSLGRKSWRAQISNFSNLVERTTGGITALGCGWSIHSQQTLANIPREVGMPTLQAERIDMIKLLKDNMKVVRRLAMLCYPFLQARDTRHPQMTQNTQRWPDSAIAHQAPIVSEARRGGRGWQLYDAAFWQQIGSIKLVKLPQPTSFYILYNRFYTLR